MQFDIYDYLPELPKKEKEKREKIKKLREEIDAKNEQWKKEGNIGVTTSQQMLESEREVALFNFIGIIAHDIIKLIAICIY